MLFKSRFSRAQREQIVGIIAVVLTFAITLLCVGFFVYAFGEDLRLQPGCHPVFGCEVPAEASPSALPAPSAALAPLFTPEIVARDTPPEMLQLLNAPTLEHAQAFVAKERERLQATMDAQRLIDAVKKGRTP